MAIDPGTHIAAIATSCQLRTARRTRTRADAPRPHRRARRRARTSTLSAREKFFHGGSSCWAATPPIVGIDTVNHLILQRSMFCPAVLGNFDLNARVCLNEYDETGRLVKTVPGLFSDGDVGSCLQRRERIDANRARRADRTELTRFSSQATTVQPYSY